MSGIQDRRQGQGQGARAGRGMVRALALGASLLAAQAGAQTPALAPDAQAQEGLRRQEERARQQPVLPAAPDLLAPAPPPAGRPAPLPQESPCFPLRQLRLAGEGSQSFDWLTAAPARRFLGACLGTEGLSLLARELDEALLARGYFTSRVSFGAQNLADGELVLQLHLGRVAAVRMVQPADEATRQPERDDTAWGTWRNAVPLRAGDLLNVRDLEQGVEQMKRLPSQAVRTRIEPGEAPDSSVVVIERPAATFADRLRGSLSVDNSGSGSLGRTQAWASVVLDNPAGLNDIASLSLGSNLEHVESTRRSQSAGLQYSVPWGYSTLSLGASHNRFAQYVQGTTVRFLSSGRSETADLRLEHTLWRSSSARLGVHGGVVLRRAESYLDDVELIVQRRRTTTAEAGVQWRRLFERSTLEGSLALRQGVGWHDAQDDLPDTGPDSPTLRPRIWSHSAQWSTSLPAGWGFREYTLSLRGQRTHDATLSVDQIAIGGRGTVRGFSGDTVLMAESGVVLRNEWVAPLPAAGAALQLVLGLDWGRVWGPSALLLPGQSLAGVSLGLRGQLAGLLYDVTAGLPLHQPDGFGAHGPSLYLSLAHTF